MYYFIQPNILVSKKAEETMTKLGISEEEIFLTFSKYDNQEKRGYNSYLRRKKFYQTSVALVCEWNETKNSWIIRWCSKKSQ